MKNIRPLVNVGCLLLALVPTLGCATILGTALSPLYGPIDVVQNAIESDFEAQQVFFMPLGIVFSPIAGLLTGMGVDFGFLEHGDYSNPPFLDISRPWSKLPGH